MIAPIITAATAFIALSAVPLLPEFEILEGDSQTHCQQIINVGLLYVLGHAWQQVLHGPLFSG